MLAKGDDIRIAHKKVLRALNVHANEIGIHIHYEITFTERAKPAVRPKTANAPHIEEYHDKPNCALLERSFVEISEIDLESKFCEDINILAVELKLSTESRFPRDLRHYPTREKRHTNASIGSVNQGYKNVEENIEQNELEGFHDCYILVNAQIFSRILPYHQ